MKTCLHCLAPIYGGGCMCTGSELRAVMPTWTRCPCGCEQAAAGYSAAADPRKCPGCGATRMSASGSCACGHRGGDHVRKAPMSGVKLLAELLARYEEGGYGDTD